MTDCFLYIIHPIKKEIFTKKKKEIIMSNLIYTLQFDIYFLIQFPNSESLKDVLLDWRKRHFFRTAKNSNQFQGILTSGQNSRFKRRLNDLIRNLELSKNKMFFFGGGKKKKKNVNLSVVGYISRISWKPHVTWNYEKLDNLTI